MRSIYVRNFWMVIIFCTVGIAATSGQSITSSATDEVYEVTIDADFDQYLLFQLVRKLEYEYAIQCRFDDYKIDSNGLTAIDLELTAPSGETMMIKAANPNGIQDLEITINPVTEKLVYGGSKMSRAGVLDFAKFPRNEPVVDVATTNTPPSTVDMVEESSIDQDIENDMEAKRAQSLREEQLLKEREAAEEERQAQALAAKIEREKMLEEKRIADKAREVAAEEARRKAAEDARAREEARLQQERDLAARQAMVQKQQNEERQRQKVKEIQEDAAGMKRTMEELKKLEDQDRQRAETNTPIVDNYIIINGKAYEYQIKNSRTYIYGTDGTVLLLIPAPLDDREVSGPTSINNIAYKFHFKDYVIELYNGAGELVDLQGKPL